MCKYSLSKKVMPGACIGIHKDGDLMRRDTIVHELNQQQAIIEELEKALKNVCTYKCDVNNFLCKSCFVTKALNKVENNG